MKHYTARLLRVVLPSMLVCSMACQSTVYAKTKPLPLGQISEGTLVACPANAAPGAVCNHYTVTDCKDANGNLLQDLGVTLGVTQGQVEDGNKSKGTIILHSGGTATTFFNTAGFADYYAAQGYNVVQ